MDFILNGVKQTLEPTWLVSNSGKYNASETCNTIRHHQPKVDWYRLLWFPINLPKHGIISWMAILEKLPTLHRLSSWNLPITDDMFYFGKQAAEDRDHSFFSYLFSNQVWSKVLVCSDIPRSVEFHCAKQLKGKSLPVIILKNCQEN